MPDARAPELVSDQPLDIQHDTEPPHEQLPPRRIPHIGHALLYLSLTFFCICLCQALSLAAVHGLSAAKVGQHPYAEGVGELLGYVLTFAIAIPLFPAVWRCSFAEGISFNLRAMRRNWWKLVLIGALTTAISQIAINFFQPSSRNDLMQFLSTPLVAWITVALIAILPPLSEEVAFRGFLLPAMATAYDWLALERSAAGLARWQQAKTHTRSAWTFAVALSSLAFAALHGPEYGWSAGSLVVLFFASVVFSLVRIKLRSVAASTLVHVVYNAVPLLLMIFVTGGFHHLDKLR